MKSHDVAELAQTLFEEIGDAAFITDPGSMRLVDVNPMAQRMTRLPRGELLQQTLDQLFRSSDDDGLVYLQRALHTTQTFHSQEGYFLRRGAGDTWLPVNLTLTRLHTERGRLGLVLARDVTERVQAEEKMRLANATLERRVQERTAELTRVNGTLQEKIAEHERADAELRNSEARFRSAFEHTGVAMALTDAVNRFVRVNGAFAQLFGYAPEQMLNMMMVDVTHPDDLAESYARRETLLAGEEHFFQIEKRYRHRDGHTFWGLTSVSLVRDVAGMPFLYVGQVQDITERKRAEQKFRNVLEAAPDAMVIVNSEGRIVLVNSQTEKTFGYRRQELLGEPFEILLPERFREWYVEDRKAYTASPSTRQMGAGLDLNGRRAGGAEFPVEVSLSQLQTEEGTLIVSAIRDMTEGKRLEAQFRQAQKMEAVGRLAGGVAHDFNNLLTVINGYGDLMLGSLAPDDPNRELVQEMVAAGERASGLTRQLLAFSRKAVIEPKVLDLRVVVADVERMLRRIVGEDIQLAVAADPSAGAVKADAGQIEQVILNLVVNARDAMPKGGRLTIEVKNVELDENYCRTRPDARPGRYVMLAVADSGCGMDAATMAHVFEPFFTTKGEHGTGLGLATVHSIVRQSGGHVGVYSELGRGATFKVYLPRIETRQAASPSRIGPASMPRGNETLLLVEDEEGVRALTGHVLRGCGYTVLEARNGDEAVRIAEERSQQITLLVTDVVMPGSGGRVVAERIKEIYPGIKVLYLSGYTDDAVVRHGILEAEVAFLQKPFTPSSLAGKVRQVLDSRQG